MDAIEHYDDAYYETHYSRIWRDPSYYQCQAQYWRHVIFERNQLDATARVLDYGSGLGQVSAALPNRACFDVSPEARAFMRGKGAVVFDRPEDIPTEGFDAVLCSHTLEHHADPQQSLISFLRFVKPGGTLILALPVEVNLSTALQSDSDRHFYAWTFQTISNLLRHVGWVPVRQNMVHGSWLLATLGSRLRLPMQFAVRLSATLGRWRREYPTLLTVATKDAANG